MAHFLHDQRRRVLIDHLVDRDHHAHLHQHLDDLVGLDGHALGELADRDRVADLHLADDGCRRLLEYCCGSRLTAMLRRRCFFFLRRPPMPSATCIVWSPSSALRPCALFVLLSRALGLGALLRLFLGLRGLAALLVCALLGCFVGCCRAPLVLRAACSPLPRAARPRAARVPPPHAASRASLTRRLFGVARVFLCATRRVELFLLLVRLLFEDVAFDVGALLTHLAR